MENENLRNIENLLAAKASTQPLYEFLRLVKEENIDRFMGKMAYESHENPAWYNLLTLITGWLPYTLLLLFSLFILPWKMFSKTRFLENAKKATPLQVFTWLAFLLVLFFYCIPKSKRSVYLLPCYPFMAYLIAEYIVWMMKEKMGALKVYAGVIASITLILNIALLVVKKGWVPESIFHGKHAIDNIAMLHALENNDLLIPCSIFMVITLEGVYLIFRALKKKNPDNIVSYTLATIVGIFLMLDSSLQPPVLNTKADKHLAPVIEKKFDTSKLYSYMSVDMLHFFSLNFYLGEVVNSFGVSDHFEMGYALNTINQKAKTGKPFMATILTVSNHPPYIIPDFFKPKTKEKETQIVEYADWAIGDFLKKASREPWYKNTIFVIQADHGKLVGKSEGELPQSYNHIPLIIFGPGVPQQQYAGLGMQVDVMPTLFGLMNLNYEYEGFGVDLLKQQRPMVFYSADNQIVARDHQRCFVYNPSMNRSFCYDVLPNGNLKETKQESKFQDLKNYVFSNIQAAEYIERHQQ
jgi:hypothetical protein